MNDTLVRVPVCPECGQGMTDNPYGNTAEPCEWSCSGCADRDDPYRRMSAIREADYPPGLVPVAGTARIWWKERNLQ